MTCRAMVPRSIGVACSRFATLYFAVVETCITLLAERLLRGKMCDGTECKLALLMIIARAQCKAAICHHFVCYRLAEHRKVVLSCTKCTKRFELQAFVFL